MLGSPVATQRYMYPSEFQESLLLRFYRYHGPDKKSRGCKAITPELSKKSRMSTNMAAMTNVNTALAMTAIVFMSFSQFLNAILCFQEERINWNICFKDLVDIYKQNANHFIYIPGISGHLCHLH